MIHLTILEVVVSNLVWILTKSLFIKMQRLNLPFLNPLLVLLLRLLVIPAIVLVTMDHINNLMAVLLQVVLLLLSLPWEQTLMVAILII
jgi:hypothetical protein